MSRSQSLQKYFVCRGGQEGVFIIKATYSKWSACWDLVKSLKTFVVAFIFAKKLQGKRYKELFFSKDRNQANGTEDRHSALYIQIDLIVNIA